MSDLKGRRVRLTADYHDEEQNLRFTAGQTGTAGSMLDRLRIVDFDGYEAERAQNEQLRRKYGEGWNIVPWLGLVPERLLAPDVPPSETP